MKVVLQAHQAHVVDYFVKSCCKQKGLLLFHKVGTGKTLTALHIALGLSNLDCVVFAPRELLFMWEDEVKKHAPARGINIHPLDKMAVTDVQGKLVIVDEAHFWVQWLMGDDDDLNKRATKAFENLQNAARRVLLTGSPVMDARRGAFDIGLLCNLAVGEEKFPFAFTEFFEKYARVDAQKSRWWGWVLPIAATCLGFGASMATFMQFFFSSAASGFTPMSILIQMLSTLLSMMLTITVVQNGHLIKTINIGAFARDARSSCSFFDSIRSPDFPIQKIVTIESKLTFQQAKLWTMMCRQLITSIDLKRMKIESFGPSVSRSSVISGVDEYLDKGRRIGIVSDDEKKPPPKFIKAFETMEKAGFQGCVVYSELDGCMGAFARFLTDRSVPFTHLLSSMSNAEKQGVLDRFTDNKGGVLLLGIDMYFGITVRGARQLHVLEPIMSMMKRVQLYGRVARYRSHAHLPPSERTVTVFVHVATSNKYDPIMTTRIEAHLKTLNRHMLPGWADKVRGARGTMLPDTFTPDEIITQNDQNMDADIIAAFAESHLLCPRERRCGGGKYANNNNNNDSKKPKKKKVGGDNNTRR